MTAKLSFVSVAALAALPMTFACGGDDGAAHPVTHDASMGSSNQMDAPSTPNCLAANSYTPTLAADEQGGTDYPDESGSGGPPHEIFFGAPLNDDPVPDNLYIDLWQNYGAFTGSDIHTGEFTISGEETDFSTCGVCILVAADEGAETVGQWYVAQGGVVNLTSVTGNLKGTLTNITLSSADTDPDTGLPADGTNGTCQTTITSASFDGPVEPAGSNAVGKPSRIRVRVDDARVLRHRYR